MGILSKAAKAAAKKAKEVAAKKAAKKAKDKAKEAAAKKAAKARAAAKRKAEAKKTGVVTPKQKKNYSTGNTSTAPAANPARISLAKRGKQSASKGPQKAYDRIAGELAWLKKNNGSPESIRMRTQSLKDMKVNRVIKPKKSYAPIKPVGGV